MNQEDVERIESLARAPLQVSLAPIDGEQILNDVLAYLLRFVAFPSEHAAVAVTLWVAHAHLMEHWESTPRLAILSPEPGSGKTRVMELTETLVPRPVAAVNCTPAFLFRRISSEDGLPTILHDEIDTIFGARAKDHEEIRGVINAGHRRGAVAGRCVVKGKTIETEELPAFCAVGMAGLGNLPDTILSRSIIVKMRRRGPDEIVEGFRRRLHAPEGHALRDRLAVWAESINETIDIFPVMPPGIEDRAADVWEALLSVADAAGGTWPERARVAAVALVAEAKGGQPSLGVRLLSDCRAIFAEHDMLSTVDLLNGLTSLEEAPWSDLRGKPLDARRLANLLHPYEIKSKVIRIGNTTPRGYTKADFHDTWARYLPSHEGADVGASPTRDTTSATSATDSSGVLIDED